MFNKRVKIFVFVAGLCLAICVLKLAQLQIRSSSVYREKIEFLKEQRSYSRQFKTLRGKILDRNGRVLATDEPRFYLEISYELASVLDERVGRAKLLEAGRKEDSDAEISKVQNELAVRIEEVTRILDKCTNFGIERAEIEERITQINDRMWNLRSFIAWRRSGPAPEILMRYPSITSVPQSVAMEDFERRFAEPNDRLRRIARVNDIAEMAKSAALLELKTEDEIFTAQLEFIETEGVEIRPQAVRVYPYDSTAAQVIGWVGPPQSEDEKLFEGDRLVSYLGGEVCGREDGVEYVCEEILRGRRGEAVYDIDRQLEKRTETIFGRDVYLTIDIELQRKIEQYLGDETANPENFDVPMAAAVIELASGEILAMASLPSYDLNRVRYDYGELAAADGKPLVNRVINELYPPGSVIKPVIYIAGAESGVITAGEAISCPAHDPPKGWPRCWIQKKYSWLGHDEQFSGEGGNIARNALRGSCNIYFSRLADRIEPIDLQKWLYAFGYGRKILPRPQAGGQSVLNRNLRQYAGAISSKNPDVSDPFFGQLPELKESDRRWFGMGQGNLRVTVLQVAGAMATIARGGFYRVPRIFEGQELPGQYYSLDISPEVLKTVREGMSAVVNEPHGTAYEEFRGHNFSAEDVTVYGKTGSTEKPEHAWFAGFAEESGGRGVAIAVVVEGGEQGSKDAAPLARDIIRLCIEAGYLGTKESAVN